MSKILYIEPCAGIAGDMFAGSTLGLLDNHEEFLKQINSLPIKNEFEIKVEKVVKAGISANKFDVILHTHHDHHKHDHHHGRHLSEIIDIINKATAMSTNAQKRAIEIFKTLAKAESTIHGTVSDKVHFHEVGAIDAIVDICSAAIIVELLGVDEIVSCPVSTGTGTVNIAHGTLPVPAPATELLLNGLPVNKTDVKSELTTPTGAAILKTIVTSWDVNIKGTTLKSSYSAGTKDLKEIVNILRTSLIEKNNDKANHSTEDNVTIIECNIDDYPGEHFTFIEKALFAAGALDYILLHGNMKKSRPGVLLQVVTPTDKVNKVSEVILQHTSTNGIRYRTDQRIKLERKMVLINTPLGAVTAKLIFKDGKPIKSKPEQKDIDAIAIETDRNYVSILSEVNFHIQKWIKENY